MVRVLVTGGAGYIGSHVLLALKAEGHETLAYDNLSTGNEWALLGGDLIKADLADCEALSGAFADFQPEAVMHFAASIEVGESVTDPLKYYRNNVVNSLNLIEATAAHGNCLFVFSSSAAVYGEPSEVPIGEDALLRPVNPYGASKLMTEQMLQDVASAREDFKYVALRYFNVAGADPKCRLGQVALKPTHLITRALKAASGEYDSLVLFGTDYPTPDGTCIRDYIHVDDLAGAHVTALGHLGRGSSSGAFNCGYGHGYSVREVIETVKTVTGVDFNVTEGPRRAGDPPSLVARSDRLREAFGWEPAHADLGYIISTAWNWEKKLRQGR